MQTLDAAHTPLDKSGLFCQNISTLFRIVRATGTLCRKSTIMNERACLLQYAPGVSGYLGLYFLQIVAWLLLLVVTEVYNVESTDIMGKRVLGAAVTMSFIGQGTLGSVDI